MYRIRANAKLLQVFSIVAEVRARSRDYFRHLTKKIEIVSDVSRTTAKILLDALHLKADAQCVQFIRHERVGKIPRIIHDAVVCNRAGDDDLGHTRGFYHTPG